MALGCQRLVQAQLRASRPSLCSSLPRHCHALRVQGRPFAAHRTPAAAGQRPGRATAARCSVQGQRAGEAGGENFTITTPLYYVNAGEPPGSMQGTQSGACCCAALRQQLGAAAACAGSSPAVPARCMRGHARRMAPPWGLGIKDLGLRPCLASCTAGRCNCKQLLCLASLGHDPSPLPPGSTRPPVPSPPAAPHMGSAYPTIAADAVARYQVT